MITVRWVKVKVHTLDIAPLRSESPPQKRSGMTRVLKGFHSFTCTPAKLSMIFGRDDSIHLTTAIAGKAKAGMAHSDCG